LEAESLSGKEGQSSRKVGSKKQVKNGELRIEIYDFEFRICELGFDIVLASNLQPLPSNNHGG